MKIPQNTSTFTFYNANPRGKKTSDCVVRAICTALNEDYDTIARELLEFWLMTGYHMSDVKCFGKYLESKGWIKQKQPRKSDNTKFTGGEFAKHFRGTCIANIGGHHIVCIVNGKILDIWDSSKGCIGNYWIKDI